MVSVCFSIDWFFASSWLQKKSTLHSQKTTPSKTNGWNLKTPPNRRGETTTQTTNFGVQKWKVFQGENGFRSPETIHPERGVSKHRPKSTKSWGVSKSHGSCIGECTLPETNSRSTWKWMVGRWLSFWETLFSGAMLVSGGGIYYIN